MALRLAWLSFALLAAGTALAEPPKEEAKGQKPAAKLSPRMAALVRDEVVPAYEARDFRKVARALKSAAAWSEAQAAAVDELLAAHNAPPVAELLAEAWVESVRLGGEKETPAPKGRELEMVLRGFRGKFEREFQQVRDAELLADPLPLPESFASFEALVWQAHVTHNRLANLGAVWNSVMRLAQTLRPVAARDAQLQPLAEVARTGSQLSEELEERTLATRLERLKFSLETLKSSQDLAERFQAAYALDFDGEALQNALADAAKNGRAFRRPELADPALAADVRQFADEGRKLAGADLLEKSKLFFDAVHYFLRGRYGRGTHDAGLMKSPVVLQNPALLPLLYMPAIPPKANDPFGKSYPVPPVDRRHHYVWASEQSPRFVWEATYFL
jgi:hypothetical protein